MNAPIQQLNSDDGASFATGDRSNSKGQSRFTVQIDHRSKLRAIFVPHFHVPEKGIEPIRLSAQRFECCTAANFVTPGKIVRMKGIEPPRLSALDPKSSLATSFNTSAFYPFNQSLYRQRDSNSHALSNITPSR